MMTLPIPHNDNEFTKPSPRLVQDRGGIPPRPHPKPASVLTYCLGVIAGLIPGGQAPRQTGGAGEANVPTEFHPRVNLRLMLSMEARVRAIDEFLNGDVRSYYWLMGARAALGEAPPRYNPYLRERPEYKANQWRLGHFAARVLCAKMGWLEVSQRQAITMKVEEMINEPGWLR